MLTARETSAIFHESRVRQAMTKRSNPFADYVPRQIKTCVTPDLIATEEEKRAVCGEQCLKLVRRMSIICNLSVYEGPSVEFILIMHLQV